MADMSRLSNDLTEAWNRMDPCDDVPDMYRRLTDAIIPHAQIHGLEKADRLARIWTVSTAQQLQQIGKPTLAKIVSGYSAIRGVSDRAAAHNYN
jgi:hypothetical protein